MHTIACQSLWLLVSQLTLGQFSPVDNVQLQPAPMSVELNAPTEQPVLVRPRFSGLRTAPATPIEQRGTVEPNQASFNHQALNQYPAQTPVRSNIARMSYNEPPLTSVNHEEDRNSAAALLRLSLAPLGSETLEGRPTTLLAAIERTGDRGEQLQLIRAYWRLSARIAEFHWAVKESAFLASLPQPRTPTEQILLHAARGEASAREQETRLAAVAAQYDLAEIAHQNPQEPVPFPADSPFVGTYRTNFTTIFASRTPSLGVTRLSQTIPIYHELIEARTAAATSAFESLQALEDAYGKGQVPLADVLKSYDRLNSQRLAFVNAVRDYNFAIAEYSLAVVSSQVSRQQIVATLIKSVPQNRATMPAAPASRGPARAAFHDPGLGRVPNHNENSNQEFAPPVRFGGQPENGAGFAAPPVEQTSPSRASTPTNNWRSSTFRQEEPLLERQLPNRGVILQDPSLESNGAGAEPAPINQLGPDQPTADQPVTVTDPNQPPLPPSFRFNNSP